MDTGQLKSMFLAAVAAVDPADAVEAALRARRLDAGADPVTVLALGKAAAGMVHGAYRVFGNQLVGVAVLPEAAELPGGVTGFVGSHPIPDAASVVAGEALIAAADRVPAGSLVICLISGGGSALAEVPASGVTIDDLATVNRLLLESGAAIDEVNAVRRRLSRLKGGGLAGHVASSRLLTLAISDVGAAGPETIASGPTIGSVSGPSPRQVLEAYRLIDAVPASVVTAIESAVPGTGPTTEVEVIADGAVAAAAATAEATRIGLTSWHSDRLLAGEASDEAYRVIDDARRRAVDVAIYTGETTVAVTGRGVGGRNHEAALAAAIRLDGHTGIFLAGGTDGVDGMTTGAGAVVDANTAATARELGVDPQGYLARNDSGGFFDKVPGRIVTGPTGTNVADIWLVAAAARDGRSRGAWADVVIELPTPYRARGATPDDIEAIWRLMVTVNMSESGTPGFGRTEIENWLTGDWMVMGEDVAVVIDAAGDLVGVELFDSREPYVRPIAIGGVHPDHVGRGLGHALLAWAKQRATDQLHKAPPDTRVTWGSYSAQGHEPSTSLMTDMGLEFSRYFMDMEIEFDGRPPAPDIPDGVTIRLFDPEAELAALALVTQEAFRDHYGFVESPLETRISRLEHWMKAADHNPALWWVAEQDGELVGHNLCFDSNEGDETVGYVGTLGVLRSHRGRGLGRALLLTSFGAFFDSGKKGAALGVDADSLTGATRLYESVGMHPGVSYAGWELELRPGVELATVDIADG